jgi:hypothetical protein
MAKCRLTLTSIPYPFRLGRRKVVDTLIDSLPFQFLTPLDMGMVLLEFRFLTLLPMATKTGPPIVDSLPLFTWAGDAQVLIPYPFRFLTLLDMAGGE